MDINFSIFLLSFLLFTLTLWWSVSAKIVIWTTVPEKHKVQNFLIFLSTTVKESDAIKFLTLLVIIGIASPYIYPITGYIPPMSGIIRDPRPVIIAVLLLIITILLGLLISQKMRPKKVSHIVFPAKLYEGDSKILSVNIFTLNLISANPLSAQPLSFVNEKGEKYPIGIGIKSDFNPTQLEVELLAAGFDLEGEKKQKKDISTYSMGFQWNMRAPVSGVYEIGLVFRALNSSGKTIDLGTITHKINVYKIAFLTSRQIWLMTSIFGLITGIFGILEILKNIGISLSIP